MISKQFFCPEIRKIELQNVEIPDRPGPYEIIVKTAYSLISAGTELAVYSGSHIGYSIPNSPFPKLPWAVGYASSGVVQAIGEKVEGFAINDNVSIIAPHSDFTLCDIRTTVVRRLPSNVSFEQGALARMGGISLLGILDAKISIGEGVAVFGLGLIGQFAAQLSHIHGARPVVGIDFLEHRRNIANKFNIQTVNPDNTVLSSRVEDFFQGHRPDVILETTGKPDAICNALKMAAVGGRVIELGSPREKIEIDVYSTIHRNRIAFTGVHDRLAPLSTMISHLRTRPSNLELILNLFSDGSMKSEGLITHIIQPREMKDTYESLLKNPDTYLGVLIEWEKA